ncbi:hypothetical protein [uncultured Clostridium sp.]|uniref:hypothetical protein n=1 Tax=uncultured Clostridium sp. TaxID=59620 RepID=UPI00262C4CA6|nr:hypothetical protein [uncultured Clostridium sp.]
MDKQEFNKLDIQDQLKYINNILVKGESLRNISSNLGISKTIIDNRFIEQCYIFNKEAMQYIKNNEYKEDVNIFKNNDINKKMLDKENINININILNDDTISKYKK